MRGVKTEGRQDRDNSNVFAAIEGRQGTRLLEYPAFHAQPLRSHSVSSRQAGSHANPGWLRCVRRGNTSAPSLRQPTSGPGTLSPSVANRRAVKLKTEQALYVFDSAPRHRAGKARPSDTHPEAVTEFAKRGHLLESDEPKRLGKR